MTGMSLEEVKKAIDLKTTNWKNINNSNCYAFALGLDLNQNDICPCAFEIGKMYFHFRNIVLHYIPQLERLKLDLETLSIIYQECDIDSSLNEDEWKIAYLSDKGECGYHFLRQMPDGVWYHKPGFGYVPTNLDLEKRTIKDPKQVITDYKNWFYQNYDDLKCYKLKRRAINNI